MFPSENVNSRTISQGYMFSKLKNDIYEYGATEYNFVVKNKKRFIDSFKKIYPEYKDINSIFLRQIVTYIRTNIWSNLALEDIRGNKIKNPKWNIEINQEDIKKALESLNSDSIKLRTDIREFKKLHELLMKNAPEGYEPYYFPLEPNGKDPLEDISWKPGNKNGKIFTGTKKTFAEACKLMEEGFNIGIAGTDKDKLTIADADDISKVGNIKETLTVISRKQIGRHYYYFTNDKIIDDKNEVNILTNQSAKQNLPTDAGELRAVWQYVVAPGSFVECSKDLIEKIPEEDRPYAGLYRLANELPASSITFNELPEIYKNVAVTKNESARINKLNKDLRKTHNKIDAGKNKSALWDLNIHDVTSCPNKPGMRFSMFPEIHGSETEKNASIDYDLLTCWRHNVSHNGLTFLVTASGVLPCEDAGYSHGSGYTKSDFKDPYTVFTIWKYAKDKGYIPKHDPIPSQAMVYYALNKKLCNKEDIIDGWKLPIDIYNKVLEECEKDGIQTGRKKFSKEEETAESLYPYVLTPVGVGKYLDTKDYEDSSKTKPLIEYFLHTPVYVSALSNDLDGDKILYKIIIEHPVIGHIELWKEQGELLTRSGINKLLNEGLIGIDSSCKDVTKYFMKDILKAAKEAPTEFIAHKTGWKRDNTIFVAGKEAYTAEGIISVNLTDKEVSSSFTKVGTLEEWVKGCRWILQYDCTRINCYTVFAAPISGILKQPSPVFQNKGATTTGKTLKSATGISMIGDPVMLVKSADTTRTAAERDAIATNGTCSILDEVGLLKNPDGLTYLLSNGRKKQRGTKEGREENEYWFKSFILNGEFELLKESAAQGEIGRLIECPWQLPINAIKAKSSELCIRENFGHIAPLFFKKLFAMLPQIKNRYEELCTSLPSSDVDIGSRLKDSFALIIVAGEILEEVFEEIGLEKKDAYYLCEKLYLENIGSERVKPYWKRGLSIIFDEINACKPEIGSDGEETGKFYYKGQIGGQNSGVFIDILPASFKDMCNEHGFVHTQLMKEWRDNGITEVDKPGKDGVKRSQKTVTIKRGWERVIRLITANVYKALELTEEKKESSEEKSENISTAQKDPDQEPIGTALLKHDIQKHLKKFKEENEKSEEYEGFNDSFFREYPFREKYYTGTEIKNLIYEMEANSE